MFEIIKIMLVAYAAGTFTSRFRDLDLSLLKRYLLGFAGGLVGAILLAFVGIYGYGLFGSAIVSIVGSNTIVFVLNIIKHHRAPSEKPAEKAEPEKPAEKAGAEKSD